MGIVVKNSKGRVIEYFTNASLEEIKEKFSGYTVEETEHKYSKKWDRWWISG